MKTTIALFICIFTMIQTSEALAHKVRIFAWEDGGNIVTESKFNSGRVARQADITVYAGEKIVVTGKTDDSGLFSFPLPKEPGEFNIVVSTGDGHRGSWLYSTEDEDVAETPPSAPAIPPPTTQTSSIDYQRIETTVARVLDKQLAPIRRQLAEAQDHKPTIQDILGGIGYILGLAGITAYMQSRKKGE